MLVCSHGSLDRARHAYYIRVCRLKEASELKVQLDQQWESVRSTGSVRSMEGRLEGLEDKLRKTQKLLLDSIDDLVDT